MVVCSHCGKKFERLEQVLAVHSVGLALMGTCPNCEMLVNVSILWHCTERINYPDRFPVDGVYVQFHKDKIA